MSEPMVIKPSDKSLLIKIRDEYVKPNAKVGTSAYLCSFLSQLADRIEQLERDLNEAKANAESWESACKVACSSTLPCGHPNDYGYDKNNDGKWSHIGCVGCELSALKKQIQDGELVPVEVVGEWLRTFSPYDCITETYDEKNGLKQFAAERAKAANQTSPEPAQSEVPKTIPYRPI
jgi:hypothetical protein